MTIRKRLARSNLIMILIPMAIAAALLLLGGGLAVLLLKRVYLPRLGLSMAALHETGERLEAAFDGAKTIAAIYGGTVILALLAASGFTNLYLTKHLFRHIQKPLDILDVPEPAWSGFRKETSTRRSAMSFRTNSSLPATRSTRWQRG